VLASASGSPSSSELAWLSIILSAAKPKPATRARSRSRTATISGPRPRRTSLRIRRCSTRRLAAHAEEAKHGGCKAACKGIEASITVYEAAVAGDQAKLDKLGAPEPVAPKAEKFAEILALFGADKAQAKAVLSLLEPFLYTLLFEYGSIVAWGYAFRRRSASSPAEGSPNRGGGRKLRRFAKEEAAADLVTRLALGERFGSQDELREWYGVAKSTMSDWLSEWEANGLIPARLQSGRCKALVRA
jgi:hypothetical protein